jgi:hypothetical protein
MAPIINTTKLVATAIATFVSTDKFIKCFPFNYGGRLDDHSFLNFPFWIASNFNAPMDATTKN